MTMLGGLRLSWSHVRSCHNPCCKILACCGRENTGCATISHVVATPTQHRTVQQLLLHVEPPIDPPSASDSILTFLFLAGENNLRYIAAPCPQTAPAQTRRRTATPNSVTITREIKIDPIPRSKKLPLSAYESAHRQPSTISWGWKR